MEALSTTGAYHIDRLKLNRQQLVDYRIARRRENIEKTATALHLERIKELEERIIALEMLVREVSYGD